MIRLRPTEPQDSWLFWQVRWQEDHSISQEEHQAWWDTIFEHRFVAYDGPAVVGIIRITPKNAGPESTVGVISITVSKSERGKGFGTQMLVAIKRVAKDLGLTTLKATVSSDNVPSRKAFLTAGYAPIEFEVTL